MASKKSAWPLFSSTVLRDDSAGRPSFHAGLLDIAASPDGRYVAISTKRLPTEPKQASDLLTTQVFELDASSRGALVYEVADAGGKLAVAADGSVVFHNQAGTTLARPDGTRRVYPGHTVPRFDGAGALVANVWIDATNYLARYDLQSGELLRKDPYSAGNLPIYLLANGDLVGHGGWISPGGQSSPRVEGDWEWERAIASGNALLVRPLGEPGAMSDIVRMERDGTTTPIGETVCAASPDGRFLIVYRYPPIEEAHARGLSQHNARLIELVDVTTNERKALTQVRFPEAKVLAWNANGMVLAVHGTVIRHDPIRDEIARPLETRALILDGETSFSAHEDGVRMRRPGEERFVALGEPLGPQSLIPSPTRQRFLVGDSRNHVILLDRSLAVRDLGHATRAVFAGDDHLIVTRSTGQSELLALDGGAAKPLALEGVKSLASLPDGFVAFFDKRIELRNADGSVRTTWPVKKAPKPFQVDAVTAVFAQPDGLYVLSRKRLFRCEESGITHLLPTTEKVLGSSSSSYEGLLRAVAIERDRVAIAVFSNGWHGVLVCTLDDQIVGWTGTYGDAPVGLAWSGDTLLVTERSGLTHQVTVPR